MHCCVLNVEVSDMVLNSYTACCNQMALLHGNDLLRRFMQLQVQSSDAIHI